MNLTDPMLTLPQYQMASAILAGHRCAIGVDQYYYARGASLADVYNEVKSIADMAGGAA